MVNGGEHGGRTSVELLFSNGTRRCALPDLPTGRFHHSQMGAITCGGGGGSDEQMSMSCVTFSKGRWKKSHRLREERHAHTAWASPHGVLLMGGDSSEKLTELLNDAERTTASFNLKDKRL